MALVNTPISATFSLIAAHYVLRGTRGSALPISVPVRVKSMPARDCRKGSGLGEGAGGAKR